MSDILQAIPELNQDRRTAAFAEAKRQVRLALGVEPERKHFAKATDSAYPVWMQNVVLLLFALLLLFAFIPSATRLYEAGKQASVAITDETAKAWIGASSVVISEVGTVVFVLTLAVIGASVSKTVRRMLFASAIASTAFALVGNLQIANPAESKGVFAWLEALLPSLLTLASSYALKEIMLNIVAEHEAVNRAYRDAKANYRTALDYPDQHPRWNAFYANALLLQMRKATRSQTIRARLQNATPDEKLLLYRREIAAEEWFAKGEDVMQMRSSEYEDAIRQLQEQMLTVRIEAEKKQDVITQLQEQMLTVRIEAEKKQDVITQLQKQLADRPKPPMLVASSKSNRRSGGGGSPTGELQNAIQPVGDDFVATCPRCNLQIAKDSHLSAARALSAHMKAHKE